MVETYRSSDACCWARTIYLQKGAPRRICLGHQIGFGNGVNRTLSIDDALSKIIHHEIMEIEIGSRF